MPEYVQSALAFMILASSSLSASNSFDSEAVLDALPFNARISPSMAAHIHHQP